MLLNAGFMDDRRDYPLHHPNAQFDENVCVIGAACFAYYASHWLKNTEKNDSKITKYFF